MMLYPAIDIKGGQCVRLYQGDMAQATVFGDHPATQAKIFQDEGAQWLHVVDLDGAFEGRSTNRAAVTEILSNVQIPVQLGGGIRRLGQIEEWLALGLSRVILGTVAVKNPALVREACRLFPGKIAVGIDARGGKVATEGWAESSELGVVELARAFADAGVAAVIYTDIGRDGTGTGPDVEGTAILARAIPMPVIASGGVGNLEHLRILKTARDIHGVIVGRALYDKAFSLSEARAALC